MEINGAKRKIFSLAERGGTSRPLNGQNPLKRFWRLPLSCNNLAWSTPFPPPPFVIIWREGPSIRDYVIYRHPLITSMHLRMIASWNNRIMAYCIFIWLHNCMAAWLTNWIITNCIIVLVYFAILRQCIIRGSVGHHREICILWVNDIGFTDILCAHDLDQMQLE